MTEPTMTPGTPAAVATSPAASPLSSDVWERVKWVNNALAQGEPENITHDEHSDQTGYKPQAVIDAMNAAFPGAWGAKTLSNEFETDSSTGKQIAVAHMEVWLDGIAWHPTAYGQGKITRGDLGDARKSAQTDGIKKGLSYFSIGSRAYLGLLPNPKKLQGQQGNSYTPSSSTSSSSHASNGKSATPVPTKAAVPTMRPPAPARPATPAIVPPPPPPAAVAPAQPGAVPALTEKQQKVVGLLKEFAFGPYERAKFLTWCGVTTSEPASWEDVTCDRLARNVPKWVESKSGGRGEWQTTKATVAQLAEFDKLVGNFRARFPQYAAHQEPTGSVLLEIRDKLAAFSGPDGGQPLPIRQGASAAMLDILLAVAGSAWKTSQAMGKVTYSIPPAFLRQQEAAPTTGAGEKATITV